VSRKKFQRAYFLWKHSAITQVFAVFFFNFSGCLFLSGAFQVSHHRNIVHVLRDFRQYSHNRSVFVHHQTATYNYWRWLLREVRYSNFFTLLLITMQFCTTFISLDKTGSPSCRFSRFCHFVSLPGWITRYPLSKQFCVSSSKTARPHARFPGQFWDTLGQYVLYFNDQRHTSRSLIEPDPICECWNGIIGPQYEGG